MTDTDHPGVEAAFAKASITLDACHRVLRAAEARARELDTPMVIAIVDESGLLKAFSRMDGTNVMSMQMAQDKAYSATFGMPTDRWNEALASRNPPLPPGSYTGVDRLITFGGGYPIRVQGTVVGGLGVSGGPTEPDVARAGLDALAPVAAGA